jgi:hypothetical protein
MVIKRWYEYKFNNKLKEVAVKNTKHKIQHLGYFVSFNRNC